MQDKKTLIVSKPLELSLYHKKVMDNLSLCTMYLRNVLKEESELYFFKKAKYEKMVIDPLTGEPENLIEVINQSQTYLVTFMGASHLMKLFPNTSFTLKCGNVSDYDIYSKDRKIIAECFAATSYRSNKKLTEDLKRLSNNQTATHKYLFFYDKEFTENNQKYYTKKYPDITIIHFSDVH